MAAGIGGWLPGWRRDAGMPGCRDAGIPGCRKLGVTLAPAGDAQVARYVNYLRFLATCVKPSEEG